MSIATNPATVIENSRFASKNTAYRFPLDSIADRNWMNIAFKKYNRSNPLSPSGELGKALVNITLPLPMSGLEDNTNIKYEDQALGAAIGGAMSTLLTSAKDVQKSSVLGASVQAMRTALGTGAEFTAQAAGLPGGAAKTAVDLLAGNINNPNITLAFGGVSLRQHQFSWRFIAKNSVESNTINSIVRMLKIMSLPQQQEGNLALKYPTIAEISFNPSNLIKMSKHGMFLTDINVKYDGEGHPAFYTDGKPVVVDISLKFTDRYIITSSDYSNVYAKSETAEGIREFLNDVIANPGLQTD
jgi:hypothetical protein